MGFGSFNLSGFSPRLMAAIGFTIITLFLLALFPLIVGAGNNTYLESRTEGACELKSGGQRFDRIAEITTGVKSPNDVDWSGSNAITVTPGSSKGATCGGTLPNSGVAANATKRYYTADGSTFTLGGASAVTAIPDTIAVTGLAEGMWQDNPSLVALIVGAICLLIGVSPIGVLGMIGYRLIMLFTGGGMGGMAAGLIAALGAVIVVTLLGTFTDFINIAYYAVDANRFTVFTQSLAALAGTIRQFWGVIFIASWVGLAGLFVFIGVQKMRGSGRGGRQEAGSQLLS